MYNGFHDRIIEDLKNEESGKYLKEIELNNARNHEELKGIMLYKDGRVPLNWRSKVVEVIRNTCVRMKEIDSSRHHYNVENLIENIQWKESPESIVAMVRGIQKLQERMTEGEAWIKLHRCRSSEDWKGDSEDDILNMMMEPAECDLQEFIKEVLRDPVDPKHLKMFQILDSLAEKIFHMT